MLTLILLAVLGGGLGLLAVSLAERQPATVRDRNRRGDGAAEDAADDADDGPGADEPEIVFEVPERSAIGDPASEPAPPPVVVPPPEPPRPSPRPEPTPVPAPPRRPPAAPSGLRRVLHRPDGVRRSQAAVEGAFADVGVASIPRRLLALVGLVLVVLSVGLLVAVVVGAAVGAAVELFDQTFR